MDFTCFLFAFIDRYYDGGSTVFTAQHYASVYASAVYAVIMRLSVYPSIFLSVCISVTSASAVSSTKMVKPRITQKCRTIAQGL